MVAIKQLKGHGGSTVNGIHVTTRRAETAVAAERDKFPFAAIGAGIHSTTKGGIATINHFFYIFNDRVPWVQDIDHFFKMVTENSL
jgi:hypothetical protein